MDRPNIQSNESNPHKQLDESDSNDLQIEPSSVADLSQGDHVFVDCQGFSHHGIYVGDDRVIHFDSTIIRKLMGAINGRVPEVRESSLNEFSGGGQIYVRSYRCEETATESPDGESSAADHLVVDQTEQVLSRARSRLGEKGYDLFDNNCEHFAIWCKTGAAASTQIDSVRRVASTGAAALALGTTIIRSARLAPGPFRFFAYGAGATIAIGGTTLKYIAERKRNRKANQS